MKKSILATILVILVLASIVGITGSALADTYVFTGLGGGGTALSLMWADGHLYAGMDTGHIWRYEGDANNTWTDFASLGNPVLSLAWDGQSIYAGTQSGVIDVYYRGIWSGAGAASQPIRSLDASTAVPGWVYAGCRDGKVYRLVFRDHGDWNWYVEQDVGYPVNSMWRTSSYLWVSCSTSSHVWQGLGAPWSDDGYTGTQGDPIVIDGSMGIIAAGYNTWVYQYFGGSTWTDTGKHPGNFSVTALMNTLTTANPPTDPPIKKTFAGDYWGGVAYYNGADWASVMAPSTPGDQVEAMTQDGPSAYPHLYVSFADGRIVRIDSNMLTTNIWPPAPRPPDCARTG